MKALLICSAICALAGPARADVIIEPPSPEPATHTSTFGWRFAGGTLAVRGIELGTMGLALVVEHRVHGRWRIAGEYEYLWVAVLDAKNDGHTGNGHRANLALRRTVLESRRIGGDLQFFADAELGAGMLLASEPMTGTHVIPHAFVGLRLGYTVVKLRPDTRASAVWEPDVIVRVLAARHDAPPGLFVGLGMAWGD